MVGGLNCLVGVVMGQEDFIYDHIHVIKLSNKLTRGGHRRRECLLLVSQVHNLSYRTSPAPPARLMLRTPKMENPGISSICFSCFIL